MRQGLTALRATGGEVGLPYYLALLAEACRKAGQAEEGLTLLAEALAKRTKRGSRWWEAELYRLQGELLLAAQRRAESRMAAEELFPSGPRRGPPPAGKSLELRAAMSLSRLWQQQGKHEAARELLAPTYDWFTEGFDTADLQEAKALLDILQ